MRALILLCQAWWSCPLLLLSRLFLARSCSYSACLNGKQNVFIETRELGNDQGRDWYSYLFGKTVVMCAKSWLVNRKFCSFAFLYRGGLDPVQFTAWMARILPWKSVLTLEDNISGTIWPIFCYLNIWNLLFKTKILSPFKTSIQNSIVMQ